MDELEEQFTYKGLDRTCPICSFKQIIAFFPVKDGRICFICLDKLKFKCHIQYEQINELSTKEAIKLIKKNGIK